MWFGSNRALARVAFFALMLFVAEAGAQTVTFPISGWLPLTQNGAELGDPFDNTFAIPAIDVVGDKDNPGAFVASDSSYLYFRMRLAGSPYHTAVHHYYANLWACLLDDDQDPQTYELLAGLDGAVVPNTVDLDQNTSTGTADDIGDPADASLATYDAAFNAQYASAGSALGGNTDYFVDWAVAWTDLNNGGLSKGAAFRLVCGTGTSASSVSGVDVLDSGLNSKSFSADASDSVACGDNGCRYYDPIFKDGFEGP
jgi:hypothetical protein